ncbi:MAG: glycerol-3-phosphate acyltransferase [Dehalococcoidia bacterium]
MWDELGLIVGAYVLGSLPLMYLLGRLHGINLREFDDMHIALWRNVSRVEGLLGITFDFAKGVIAVLAARALGFDAGWVAFAGVAAVAGQMWPVFFKFSDGERGNTVGLAMSGALATKAMLIALVFVLIGAAIRTIPRWLQSDQTLNERLELGGPPSLSLPLGMAVGFAVLPVSAWLMGQPLEVILALVVLFAIIMGRRLTVGVVEDLRQPSGKKIMLLNRLLFDRNRI